MTAGTVSIPTTGIYIVSFVIQSKVTAVTFIYATVNSTSYGASSQYGTAAGYYQSCSGAYIATSTGSYSYGIILNINPTQTANVTQVYFDYSYIRIA